LINKCMHLWNKKDWTLVMRHLMDLQKKIYRK
jgi:hypothetical protein